MLGFFKPPNSFIDIDEREPPVTARLQNYSNPAAALSVPLPDQSMNSTPEVQAEIVFLPESEGGRKLLPGFDGLPWYRPHIVIQDRTIRDSLTDSDGYSREPYLGVQIVAGPSSPVANVPDTYRMSLTYFPRVDYCAVQPGATFTVREGGRIVGHGVVKARQDG